jgi:hypothetical protein
VRIYGLRTDRAGGAQGLRGLADLSRVGLDYRRLVSRPDRTHRAAGAAPRAGSTLRETTRRLVHPVVSVRLRQSGGAGLCLGARAPSASGPESRPDVVTRRFRLTGQARPARNEELVAHWSLGSSGLVVVLTQKHAVCTHFVRVSDGTRTPATAWTTTCGDGVPTGALPLARAVLGAAGCCHVRST